MPSAHAAPTGSQHGSEARVRSPHWTLFEQDGRLLLSGGADQLYWIDEAADAATATLLRSAWFADDWRAARAAPAAAAAIRQLERIGALVPADAAAPLRTLALHWFGEPLPTLESTLRQQCEDDPAAACAVLPAGSDADCIVLVRTAASWQTVLDEYAQRAPGRPHLFVDVSLHHTLSVGPYVVPGETACIACLGHRIAHRWGDAPLPPQPAASRHEHLIAALIAQATFASAAAPARYVERIASLDLQTLNTRTERVFRLPGGCPVCPAAVQYEVPDAGALPLPWLT